MQKIRISSEELTKHTFITGSTGSGKSNTIYTMIDRLAEDKVHFLVVEPAKGEYKDRFGGRKGVSVYGTNPKLTKMLRINPFRFPTDTIHILEHLDRLVEIFNVCWPMYAAMPAILKDAIERAYKETGWDLVNSTNAYGMDLFPSFVDVCRHIEQVVAESAYSADNKGDYTGALITRVKSLTNGLNGIIFSNDDISDSNLFDENVIIDLSRVGSTETKSLIMGMLVLKLQEHRMNQGIPSDAKLSHVTVLEEAHNLLKRTSTEQSSESSNLLGKSVEMLANAIAEMRTYGEGFIIADQSPGLLDMSVIRNTNTKIIMRLPDLSDRELVGKAAGLNDAQIVELGKLETGVASVTQSGWLEPVLCKVDRFVDSKPYQYSGEGLSLDVEGIQKELLECIVNKEIYRIGDRIDITTLYDKIKKSSLPVIVKTDVKKYIEAHDSAEIQSCMQKLVYDFFNAEKAFAKSYDYKDFDDFMKILENSLEPSIVDFAEDKKILILAILLISQAHRDRIYEEHLNAFTERYLLKGGAR